MEIQKLPSTMRRLGLMMLGLVLAGRAAADTLVLHGSATPTSVPGTTSVTFAKFNPALGTLTGASFSGTVNTTASVQVFSLNATPETFTNATSTNTVTVTSNADASSLSTSVSAVAGPLSGTAVTGLNVYNGVTGTTALPSVSVSAANLANYILSGGTFTMSFTTTTPVYAGSPQIPGTLFFGGSTVSGGTVDLTYTYTASVSSVPLPSVAPAGLVLIVMLAAGRFGFARWKRAA